jgi:hypothetical protein
LVDAELFYGGVAPALLGQEVIAIENGRLAPFDGYIHRV